MYTQCPQCLTYFQVTPEHLRIAQGNVRCGQCRNVFSALGNLTEEPPKTAFEDNDAELEDEIFIDEEDLEGYGEQLVEEYEQSISEDQRAEEYTDEFPDEYEEEFYIVEEETEEEPVSNAPAANAKQPVDMEKTMVGKAMAGKTMAGKTMAGKTMAGSAQGAPQHATRHNLRPQTQSANVNSKLSEAIATIERLKQSYSNLSIRNLEQNNIDADMGQVASKKMNSQPTPAQKEKERPSIPADTQTDAEGPPSSAEIFSPFIEKRSEPPKAKAKSNPPTRSADIAIEHYPDDDGVDYEEALNALNELKILEEEEAVVEAAGGTSTESVSLDDLPVSPLFKEPAVSKGNKTLSTPSSAVRAENRPLEDKKARQLEAKKPAAGRKAKRKRADVKVKSLDRKKNANHAHAKPKPQGPATEDSTNSSDLSQSESQVKYLPAIPKQLLDDFHQTHGHSNRLNSLWGMASLLLMAIFLVQTVYFKHNDLAQISRLRPWVETFCGYMSCRVGLPSDVKQLELVSQDIRSHPKVKNALLVTTTIINNARFAQAYPGLQITFTDLNGQRIAMRRFTPSEYLPNDVVQAEGMPPNTPIQVELEMMDPGSNAVNFEFDFISLN